MTEALLILNMVGRFTLTAMMAFGLIYFAEVLSRWERFGMGVIGGSSFLTIAILADTRKIGTPFDYWSPALMTYGVLIFVFARLYRFWKHRAANEKMKAAADRYYQEKGA